MTGAPVGRRLRPGGSRPPDLTRSLVVGAGWTVVGSLATWLVLRALGRVAVPLLLVFGLALVVGALVMALRLVRPSPSVIHVGSYSDPAPFAMPARPFARARRYEERLDLVRGDARHFVAVVLPELAALADERLLVTRGITRASDPEAAAVALGPRVCRFLDDTSRTRAPSVAELTAVVDGLEAL